MKHLLCEHQNTISELKADGLVCAELMQKEQDQLQIELHKKMKATLVDMQELDNETLVKELELVCSTHHVLKICETTFLFNANIVEKVLNAKTYLS